MLTALLICASLIVAMSRGPTDEELVRRFNDGDREAYSDLVRRYQDRIFTLCVRWMRDRQVAEEVSQDVFIAVYRALPRFRGEARFSTWIFRVATNHCKNRRLYRQRRHSDRHEPLEGTPREDGPARQLPSAAPGTDRSTMRSEAERIQFEEERVREVQEHAALKREYRDLKNMMVDNISVSEPRRGPLLPARSTAPLHGSPERSER